MMAVSPPRTPNVFLTAGEVQRLVRELLGCGRDAYRTFRRMHLDTRWEPLLKDVPYERVDNTGTVETGRRTMLARMKSHVLEDVIERELGITVRIVTGPDGVRRIEAPADV